MLSVSQLDEMSRLSINDADRATLVDIAAIEIDSAQSVEQRVESFLERVKNPYLFMCGDTAVRIVFDSEGKDLDYLLKNYFINRKSR